MIYISSYIRDHKNNTSYTITLCTFSSHTHLNLNISICLSKYINILSFESFNFKTNDDLTYILRLNMNWKLIFKQKKMRDYSLTCKKRFKT